MLKRKQLLDMQEAERREAGLEREDVDDLSSSSESEVDSQFDEDQDAEEMSEAEGEDVQMAEVDSEDDERSGPSKTKVMVLGSRGINSRQRHLMNDLHLILPHSKRESKFDDKSALFQLNELAELNSCTHVMYLEHRRPEDLYMWLAKCPSGPSVKFHVENIHTLDELSFPGNCMIGSRPILSFDASLSESEHGKIMQELLGAVFGTPQNCRKARPYHDHVFQFGVADGRIWFRNYQIIENNPTAPVQIDGMTLVEIGPRFVLNPVRVFSGSFCGQTIWNNDSFMTSAALQAQVKKSKAGMHMQRVIATESTIHRKKNAQIPRSEIDKVFD